MLPSRYPSRRAAIVPLIIISMLLTAQAPVPEPVSDTETELGLAVYNELKTKGEIIAASPLYELVGTRGRIDFEDRSNAIRTSLQVLPGPRTQT